MADWETQLSVNVKYLVTKGKLNLKQVSRGVGMSYSTLFRWTVLGANPIVGKDLKNLAAYFNLTVDELCYVNQVGKPFPVTNLQPAT